MTLTSSFFFSSSSFTLLPFLSPHVHHVPTFNNRLEHVSVCTESCVGVDWHTCRMCACNINQVSVVDVERAVQDKLNDAMLHTLLSLFGFSYPIFISQHSHFLNLHVAVQGFYLKPTDGIFYMSYAV